MARRERYTERARPHRQEPGQSSSGSSGGGGSADSSPMKNPVVLVAVGALALAGVLAIGVMLGQRPATPATATQPAGTPSVEVPTVAAAASPAAPTTDAAAATPAADSSGLSLPESGSPYTAPTDQKLDATKAYFATIATPKGDIVVQLWPEIAPKHVNSLVFLAREGFFDGLTFHRVEPGFVIQGGDPNGDGSGGPGYAIPGEFNAANPVPHRKGTLAMARTQDPNSAGSQFYIVLADGPSASGLDGQYTNFGHVVKGMSIVEQIAVGDAMTKVTIEEKPIAESLVSPDDIRQGTLPKND